MKSVFLCLASVLALASCQASSKSSSTPAVAAVQTSEPKTLNVLTDQTQVYTCPNCQADYDRPGKCAMCSATLIETSVAYICPADDQPVTHSGRCPRCPANARVVKTAMASKSPALSGQ